MLKIKLARMGKKSNPFYRILVSDARNHTNSKSFSIVGTYDSKSKDLKFSVEEYQKYISRGAQPTDTVRDLYKIFCRKEAAKSAMVA